MATSSREAFARPFAYAVERHFRPGARQRAGGGQVLANPKAEIVMAMDAEYGL